MSSGQTGLGCNVTAGQLLLEDTFSSSSSFSSLRAGVAKLFNIVSLITRARRGATVSLVGIDKNHGARTIARGKREGERENESGTKLPRRPPRAFLRFSLSLIHISVDPPRTNFLFPSPSAKIVSLKYSPRGERPNPSSSWPHPPPRPFSSIPTAAASPSSLPSRP